MAAGFVDVLELEIDQFKENAVPQKQKMLQNLESSYSKVGWENFSFASNTIYWKLVCLFTFFASKCRQLLVTFAKYFVLQNGFNSSKSWQMK